MFRMPTFIDDLKIRLMSIHDANQNVRFASFPEVSTETALSVVNFA